MFGSYTSPVFRPRAAALEKLAKDTTRTASFFVVYIREAHAVGEWEVERNKDAGLAVEQPIAPEQRKALAKQARDALKISIPIAIDRIDNKTASDYDGFTNAAVVIGRDGVVLARQTWLDAYALRRQLDSALESR